MNVRELLACAKPLIFENEEDTYSYSLQGTGFLVRFQGKMFGITARHCLRNRANESVRFEIEPSTENFLPLKLLHLIEETPATTRDAHDLAFYRFDETRLSEVERDHYSILDLDYFFGLPLVLQKGDILGLRGFPSELNWIDYDQKTIHTQGFSVEAVYDGPSDVKDCSFLAFSELPIIRDIDGLSGSPVFHLNPLPQGIAHNFAGVLIRGRHEWKAGMFIHSSVVYRALMSISR